jgi:uncharacterized RDD family membrane protein YckC
MTAQWINARILKRGGSEYRVTIDDEPASGEWTVVEEHSVCLDGSMDLASLETQLAQLSEPYVSYSQAKSLLADLRGGVLGQTPIAILQRKYETFWLRLGAVYVDAIILVPLLIVSWLLLAHSTLTGIRVAWFIVAQCAALVYQIVMHGLYGQTLGKMSCHVIVRDISERPLSMKQAVLRNIFGIALFPLGLWVYLPQVIHGASIAGFHRTPAGRVLSWLGVGWTVIEVVTLLANEKRRAVHDYIAGSVVIRTEADTASAGTTSQR